MIARSCRILGTYTSGTSHKHLFLVSCDCHFTADVKTAVIKLLHVWPSSISTCHFGFSKLVDILIPGLILLENEYASLYVYLNVV